MFQYCILLVFAKTSLICIVCTMFCIVKKNRHRTPLGDAGILPTLSTHPRTQCHRPFSQATRWQFLCLIKPLHRPRRLPCPPAQQSFPHRLQVLCPSDSLRLELTRCTQSQIRHRTWSWLAGETPMELSIELAMNASFPTLSSETLIGKWFVINICSIFIPSAATHLSNSAFFKAGIFVLQLNLLCCPCFARTPMQ